MRRAQVRSEEVDGGRSKLMSSAKAFHAEADFSYFARRSSLTSRRHTPSR